MERLIFGKGKSSRLSKQIRLFDTFSRSNTSLVADLRNEHVAEPTNTLPTLNVVLFGETGVGKSSVINLIARKDIARVSTDIDGCTMQSTRYDISFDGMNFAIFDTIGLEEPHFGVNGYLKAIEKAYELIMRLSAAGGIHLLLFCLRGGRITATAQSNYRLFRECLCNKQVPIALIFTGLEMEREMEDWWTRNKTHVEHYGIKSVGHACITAVRDEAPEQADKFAKSQDIIRELLKSHALESGAFSPDIENWFARLGSRLKSFIAKRRSPKRRDIVKVLTQRCKLDSDTARRIADMMEKEDKVVDDNGDFAPPPAVDGSDNPSGVAGKVKDANQNAATGPADSLAIRDHVPASDGVDTRRKDIETKNGDQGSQAGIATGPAVDGHDTAGGVVEARKDDTVTTNESQGLQGGPADSLRTQDHDTVREVVDIKTENARTKNGNRDLQAGVMARHPVSDEDEAGEGAANEDASPDEPDYVEDVPDESEVVYESLADHPRPNRLDVGAGPPVMVKDEGKAVVVEPHVERMLGQAVDRKKSGNHQAQPNRTEARTDMVTRRHDGGKNPGVLPPAGRMNSVRLRKDGIPGYMPPPSNPKFRPSRPGPSGLKQVSGDSP